MQQFINGLESMNQFIICDKSLRIKNFLKLTFRSSAPTILYSLTIYSIEVAVFLFQRSCVCERRRSQTAIIRQKDNVVTYRQVSSATLCSCLEKQSFGSLQQMYDTPLFLGVCLHSAHHNQTRQKLFLYPFLIWVDDQLQSEFR